MHYWLLGTRGVRRVQPRFAEPSDILVMAQI